jgi:hypothetical protein
VNPVGAARLAHRDLVGESREVGAQNRWGDANGHVQFTKGVFGP